jgi:hypothetical protein
MFGGIYTLFVDTESTAGGHTCANGQIGAEIEIKKYDVQNRMLFNKNPILIISLILSVPVLKAQ